MVKRYLAKHREGTFKNFSGSHERLLLNIANSVKTGKVFDVDIKNPEFSMRLHETFWGCPIVDLEYSGKDALSRFASGYMNLAKERRLTGVYPSPHECNWPEAEKIRFARTIPVGETEVSYGLRVDGNYLVEDDMKRAGIKDPFKESFLCVVPEIAETSPIVLDGIATTKFDENELQGRFDKDRKKLLDAVGNFGFETAGLKEPGDTARAGVYNVCLKPKFVNAQGLEAFLEQALGFGLESQMMFKRERYQHLGKESLAVSLKRSGDKDYIGVSLCQRESEEILSGRAAKLLGLNSDFLDTPIEYSERIENPEWERKRDSMRWIGKGLKWGTIPFWGLLYLGGRKIRESLDRMEREKTEKMRAKGRFNERLSAHIRTEFGIPSNRDYHESCVVGVTSEFMKHLEKEIAEQNQASGAQED